MTCWQMWDSVENWFGDDGATVYTCTRHNINIVYVICIHSQKRTRFSFNTPNTCTCSTRRVRQQRNATACVRRAWYTIHQPIIYVWFSIWQREGKYEAIHSMHSVSNSHLLVVLTYGFLAYASWPLGVNVSALSIRTILRSFDSSITAIERNRNTNKQAKNSRFAWMPNRPLKLAFDDMSFCYGLPTVSWCKRLNRKS